MIREEHTEAHCLFKQNQNNISTPRLADHSKLDALLIPPSKFQHQTTS